MPTLSHPPAPARTVQAVGLHRFGGPDVLEVVELPEPEPGPGEVLVDVAGATVNPTDTLFRQGLQRWSLEGLSPPYVPGMELAGEIVGLGPQVERFAPGDAVFGFVVPSRPTGGAQAERVVVPVASLARVPPSIEVLACATLPMNGLTALQAVRALELEPGATLGVTGAAGAVGGYVVQIASSMGITVVADARPPDRELVGSLGADVLVDRGPAGIEEVRRRFPDGVDAYVDAALLGAVLVSPALRPGAKVAVLRPDRIEGGGDAAPLSARDIGQVRIWVRDDLDDQRALEEIALFAGTGVLTPRVAEVLPFEDAPKAHRLLEGGGLRGRLVLSPRSLR